MASEDDTATPTSEDSSHSPDSTGSGEIPEGYRSPLALKDYVVLISEALPTDFMSELIAEAESSDDWKPAGVGNFSAVKKDIRYCDVIQITSAEVVWANRYREALVRVVNECLKIYREHFPRLQVTQGTEIQLLRYKVDGKYNEHVDHFPKAPRSLSMTFLLNDDFEGGEMTFFEQRLKLSMKPGEVVIFPANFMFPHGIQPVTSGTRYALVTWLF